MNSTDEKLLKYFEGEMSPSEKEEFEKLLASDLSLRTKLNDFMKVKESFSLYNAAEVNSIYNAPIITNRSVKNKSLLSKLFPSPAYLYSTAGTLALVVMMIIAVSYFNKPAVPEISGVASEMADTELSDAIKTFAEDYYTTDKVAEEISDSEINNYYLEEISNSTDEVSSYLAKNTNYTVSSSLVKDISEEDADNIYNELINKKIL